MKIKNFHLIQFSEFDKKNQVKIPPLNSELLAYEIGVHIGDGSLQIIPSGTHSIRYFGNAKEDWILFSHILPKIIKLLYNKNVIARKDKVSNKCVLSVCSKAVATFKQNVIGLPAGNKEKLQELPSFVKQNRKLLLACLRGIADTDFSLYFFKGKGNLYNLPEISTVTSNKALVGDIATQLRKLKFDIKTIFNVKRTRNEKQHIEHYIKIYGKENLERWMQTIGFTNPKHITKYLVWKTFGSCPSKTSTEKRILMLKQAGIS